MATFSARSTSWKEVFFFFWPSPLSSSEVGKNLHTTSALCPFFGLKVWFSEVSTSFWKTGVLTKPQCRLSSLGQPVNVRCIFVGIANTRFLLSLLTTKHFAMKSCKSGLILSWLLILGGFVLVPIICITIHCSLTLYKGGSLLKSSTVRIPTDQMSTLWL